ncbi:MAG: hypothetical protein E7589_07560 [Ruminococcaceae bacterium]|nr:hypothetical protein [Oscillospiraceae bacterium]
MPALIILGCIILLFVLLFTVRAHITIEYKDDFALSIRIFGIKISILPKKQKKYKFSNYTLKKIRRREAKEAKKQAKSNAAKQKRAAEKAKRKADEKKRRESLTKAQRKAEKKKKKAERPKVSDIVPLSLRVARLFFSRFFGKLHIKVARLRINIATGDAATTAVMYGALYPSSHLLLSGLEKISKVKGLKKADMLITPDYLGEQTTVDLKITFSVNLGGVLGAVVKAGFKFLFGYAKIKPNPDAQNAEKSGGIPLPPAPPLPPSPFGKEKPTVKQESNGEDVTEENKSK